MKDVRCVGGTCQRAVRRDVDARLEERLDVAHAKEGRSGR